LLSIVPFFCPVHQHNKKVDNVKKELFNSELGYVNSVDKAIKYTDSIYYNRYNYSEFDTAHYVQIVSQFTKERFYHGLTHYSLSDNWIANLSGKLLWSHLSAIVNPDDILKHAEGLCSQQTIVFMEILKRKKINVRSIGLGFKEGPGHFLCEVYYNNSWRLYDVTMEPLWEKVSHHHQSVAYYLDNKDSLYLAYQSRMPKPLFDKITQKVTYSEVNVFPAKNMLLFHRITFFLIYFLPFLFLFLFCYFFVQARTNK